ncbi:MAG TPA: hypothetical protein PKJ68_04070 [Candidatus Woesebacteria bacterium]|nr:hypothetical protein [Candidatus Woesebacteria bacterium]
MSKTYKYIGPEYPDRCYINVYGWNIDPKSWTPDQIDDWLKKDPRLSAFFDTAAAPAAKPVKE